MKDLRDIARAYVGQRETGDNGGFQDSDFEKKMRSVGWKTGQAWCAYFVRLCLREHGGLVDMTSPSAVATYNAYKSAGMTGTEPRANALVIWCHYDNGHPTALGHIGIVYSGDGTEFVSIEGNTNGQGSRNGDRVNIRPRRTSYATVDHGLVLLGFVYPAQKILDT